MGFYLVSPDMLPRMRIDLSKQRASRYSFQRGSQSLFVSSRHTAPARCAEMLANNETDAALIPVIDINGSEFAGRSPISLLRSKRTVESVVLASRVRLIRYAP